MSNFAHLPDEARLWVFSLARPLSDVLAESLERQLSFFVSQWTSHGRPVPGGVSIEQSQVILVSARIDESANGGVSGCGIDSMTGAVEEAVRQAGGELLDSLHVLVRLDDGKLWPCTRADIRRHVENGKLSTASEVVDTTLSTLGDLRTHGVIRPASETWVQSLLPATTYS